MNKEVVVKARKIAYLIFESKCTFLEAYRLISAEDQYYENHDNGQDEYIEYDEYDLLNYLCLVTGFTKDEIKEFQEKEEELYDDFFHASLSKEYALIENLIIKMREDEWFHVYPEIFENAVLYQERLSNGILDEIKNYRNAIERYFEEDGTLLDDHKDDVLKAYMLINGWEKKDE